MWDTVKMFAFIGGGVWLATVAHDAGYFEGLVGFALASMIWNLHVMNERIGMLLGRTAHLERSLVDPPPPDHL